MGPELSQTPVAREDAAQFLAEEVERLCDEAGKHYLVDAVELDREGYKRAVEAAPALAHKHWWVRQRRIPTVLRREILSKGTCAYCGDWANVIDHILPISRGGTRDRDNLAPACSRCNWEKLDFTPEEWRAWRAERGEPWPPLTRHQVYRTIIERFLAEHEDPNNDQRRDELADNEND